MDSWESEELLNAVAWDDDVSQGQLTGLTIERMSPPPINESEWPHQNRESYRGPRAGSPRGVVDATGQMFICRNLGT
jgi:hypothetical protein